MTIFQQMASSKFKTEYNLFYYKLDAKYFHIQQFFQKKQYFLRKLKKKLFWGPFGLIGKGGVLRKYLPISGFTKVAPLQHCSLVREHKENLRKIRNNFREILENFMKLNSEYFHCMLKLFLSYLNFFSIFLHPFHNLHKIPKVVGYFP